MAKKRGLAANRGLDALLGSIKKEKAITQIALKDDTMSSAEVEVDGESDDFALAAEPARARTKTKAKKSSTSKNAKQDKGELQTSNLAQASMQSNSNQSNDVQQSDSSKLGSEADSDISLVKIEVSRLQSGKYQPRRDMSEAALGELASSIKQHGVMQPIVIRPLLLNEDKTHPNVTHEIIAGERRWRAAKLAGETTIPAIERALSDELAIALALIENIQREDLTVIEQAAALGRFHTEFGMSHAMIADVVGKARTTVSNLLRLNHLHDTVKTQLNDGLIDMGHARALLSLPLEQQPVIAQKVIDGSMTVRETEQLVKSILHPRSVAKAKSANADILKLSEQLSDRLGAKVKLKQKKDGKGSMEIFFHNQEELDELLKHFEN